MLMQLNYTEIYCRSNHKPRKSILVEFEFLHQNALKQHYFVTSSKNGRETPTIKQYRTT